MTTPDPDRKRRGRNQSPAPDLEPVDSSSAEPVERQVYRRIRHGLMSGLIAPGATLSGRALAQQLQVSVQPVRDALKRLEADGIVEGRPQSGFFLRGLTKAEYLEILEIRQRLEGLAGFHAAANISDETIEHLRKINKRMGERAGNTNYLSENYVFHFTIYAEARMPALLSIIENLWIRIGPSLKYHPHDFNNLETLKKHEIIIDTLSRRDGPATDRAIADDLGTAAQLVVLSLA